MEGNATSRVSAATAARGYELCTVARDADPDAEAGRGRGGRGTFSRNRNRTRTRIKNTRVRVHPNLMNYKRCQLSIYIIKYEVDYNILSSNGILFFISFNNNLAYAFYLLPILPYFYTK